MRRSERPSLYLLVCFMMACGDDGDPDLRTGDTSRATPPNSAGMNVQPGAAGMGVPAETADMGDPTGDPLDIIGFEMGCDFVGSPFAHSGTATIRGTGTLPPGLESDYQLNLLVGSGGVRVGVLGDNLFDIVSVCDTPTFKYEITMVDAGDWKLYVDVLDPNEPDDALATVYEAESDVIIAVADGETVEQDVNFTTP